MSENFVWQDPRLRQNIRTLLHERLQQRWDRHAGTHDEWNALQQLHHHARKYADKLIAKRTLGGSGFVEPSVHERTAGVDITVVDLIEDVAQRALDQHMRQLREALPDVTPVRVQPDALSDIFDV